MSRSNNRNLSDIANPNNNLISVSNNDVTITGAGVTQYDSADLLPSAGINTGTQAYVAATGKLYIRGDGGWYNIATVNTTPTINSIQDASSGTSPFVLATDGSTATVITVTATDPEGFPITFSATPDTNFNNLASVAIDSSGGRIFTVTPLGEDSATSESGTLTFKATDGVNIASSVSTFSLSFSSLVVDSRHTLVLAKATGNNGTNSAFTDASSSGHTVTPSGNPYAHSVSPYRSGGYYTDFDGTGDLISVTTPAHTSFDFGTGDFTVETWFWIDDASGSEPTMFELNTSPYSDVILVNHRDGYGIVAYLNANNVSGALKGHAPTMGSVSSVASTDWTHLAIVRNGNTITLYLNGVSVDSGTYSGHDFTNQSEIIFGGSNNGNFIGKLFDLRVVKGTAVYTSTFNPPTTFLEAISGTSLLTFRTAVPYDESSNSHALTFAGNPTTASDFDVYDYKNYFSSSNSGSVYFDGTGDHITIPWSSDFEFGSGDFTIEMWYNLSDVEGLISWGADSSNRFDISGTSQTALRVLYNHASHTNFDSTSGVVIANTWQHFACARENDNLRYFINGVLQATVAMSTGAVMPNDSSNGITIGASRYATTYSDRSTGYISNLRIVKGTAVYTAAFTPPAAPLGDITNTKLLLFKGNDASVFDASQNTQLVLGTGIKSSTAQKKNAASSILFDDSAYGVTGTIQAIGTDSFTIEAWFYGGTQGTNNRIFSTGGNNDDGGFSLILKTNGELDLQSPGGTSIYETGDYDDSAWHHVALIRSNDGDGLRFYVDGVSVYSGTLSTNLDATALYIGHDPVGTFGFGGYIEDFRISKGIARYPFTPSAATLSADSNTFFLILHDSNVNTIAGDSNWTVGNGGVGPAASNFGPAAGMKSAYFNANSNTKLTLTSAAASSVYTMGNPANGAADNFSLEFWMWIDEDVYDDRATTTFSTYGEASNGSELRLLQRTDGKHRINRLNTNDDITAARSENLFPVRKWIHYYYVEEYSGSSMYVAAFANGSLIHAESRTGTASFDMQNITIGCRGDNSNPFKGYISNMRLQRGTTAFPKAGYLQFNVPTAELLG